MTSGAAVNAVKMSWNGALFSGGITSFGFNGTGPEPIPSPRRPARPVGGAEGHPPVRNGAESNP